MEYMFTVLVVMPSIKILLGWDDSNSLSGGNAMSFNYFCLNIASAIQSETILGVVTNVAMTISATAAVWTYYWKANISSGQLCVTATATDTTPCLNNPYDKYVL